MCVPRSILIYIDDIKNQKAIVLKKSMLLSKKSFRGQKKKCEFATTKVKFLGHTIGPIKSTVQGETFNKINHWDILKPIKRLENTLGFFNYVRQYIPF
jgi:hypothetical protein